MKAALEKKTCVQCYVTHPTLFDVEILSDLSQNTILLKPIDIDLRSICNDRNKYQRTTNSLLCPPIITDSQALKVRQIKENPSDGFSFVLNQHRDLSSLNRNRSDRGKAVYSIKTGYTGMCLEAAHQDYFC